MITDDHLPVDIQLRIQELKRQQKLTLPVGSSPEYNRISAKINYLRHGGAAMQAWRKKHDKRIRYERKCGMVSRPRRATKPLTDDQRAARNATVRRHEARNPQRVVRHNIERALQYFYGDCAAGREVQVRPRLRIEALLGCRPAQFREYIREQLAKQGWLWSEWRVKWTMDHVVPVRLFRLPQEERSCFHYTNLRPLAKDKNHRGHT